MDRQSRAHLTQLYRRSLERHGPTARGQRWASEESQRERFRLLTGILPATGAPSCSLADVGCGVGDLLEFLRGRGSRARYEGFDIVPEMIGAARRKQRGRGGRFQVRDVLREGFPRRYDYVVASGIFNLRVPRHDLFFRGMVEAMYAACRCGVAFNVLHPVDPEASGAYEQYFKTNYFGATPVELLSLGASVGAWVELAFSDELPRDTTVLLRRPA
ncbi:MAG TPA: class I SAM-dependent methyltransferase [Vicinamibacteria bacterium]|nr:class I SAM-dependent methyltransferase [Vicinamibacteria bacterium]